MDKARVKALMECLVSKSCDQGNKENMVGLLKLANAFRESSAYQHLLQEYKLFPQRPSFDYFQEVAHSTFDDGKITFHRLIVLEAYASLMTGGKETETAAWLTQFVLSSPSILEWLNDPKSWEALKQRRGYFWPLSLLFYK